VHDRVDFGPIAENTDSYLFGAVDITTVFEFVGEGGLLASRETMRTCSGGGENPQPLGRRQT
jgi:hypothetical protein